MTRKATYIEAALAVVAMLFVLDHFFGRPTRDDAKLATLHTHTVVAETLLVHEKAASAKAVTVYRTVRDSVLMRLTDTVLVKQVLARADTVIAKDSAALARADTVIASVKAELVEALKPVAVPRLRYTVAALYDPVNGQLSGGGGVSLRVIGGLALTVRAEQSLAVGAKPALRLGVAVTF